MSRASRFYVPFLIGLALAFAYWILRLNEGLLPRPYLSWLLFVTAIPFIFLAVRVFDWIAFDVMPRRKQVRAPLLLREIFAIVLYFGSFGWVISAIFNYSVTGLLATGTVVAAVLGLALQETLGNLFAGIALHLEDTFQVGDVIRSGDAIGVVEAIRWRGTRVRLFNNNLLILPNSMVARERLEVFPRENVNARVLQFSLDYHVPPAKVIEVLTYATTNIDGVSKDLPAFARLGGFGDSGATYEVKYFLRDYSQRDRVDAEIRKAVWYALRRNGIPFAFPVRLSQPYVVPEPPPELQPDEVLDLLANVDILAPLPAAARETLAANAQVNVYGQGETLIRRGAAGQSMLVIHAGAVAVRVDDREVARLGAGAVVGEMALLTGEARAADVVALTEVTAVEIAKSALQPILVELPDLATGISAQVASRRGTLESVRDSHDDVQRTMLSRIRDYFGLSRGQ